ncbi:winged helix-turn-helix transcriptional regulator [Nocardia grenadensis]|uniref:winged helix-turn-helix transcriptional regulator n=1 Tax=Nocardia grenadensis TaxID=931537 RepID=UPI003D73A20F
MTRALRGAAKQGRPRRSGDSHGTGTPGPANWGLRVLEEIDAGHHRFRELHRPVAGISHTMLAKTLRELEHHGLKSRYEADRSHDPGHAQPARRHITRPRRCRRRATRVGSITHVSTARTIGTPGTPSALSLVRGQHIRGDRRYMRRITGARHRFPRHGLT